MTNNNEIVQLKITDISDMGQGIGRIDGIVVFVDGALPGDTVNAQIYDKKKKFIKAKTVEIIEEGKDRTKPKCPFSNECGGCSYMSLNYEAQLLIKENHLIEKLRRIAEVDDYELEPIIGMDEPFFYRNKTEFAVSNKGVIGFNKAGTNNVVEIPKCYITSPVANEILPTLNKFFNKRPSSITKITIRTSFSTGETMVVFHGNNPNGKQLIPLIEEIDKKVNSLVVSDDQLITPSLESVYINNENKKKNTYELIAGKRTIEDEIMGLKFEISPPSFYQVNPSQVKNLIAKVKEYALASEPANSQNQVIDDKSLLDLYCGVGSLGLLLAGSVKEVFGVDVVKDAIIDANRNAVINGIINARYITAKVEDNMDELNINENSIILLDPPRAGCKVEVLESIGKSQARQIIYVSCDPATFARDSKILREFGFNLERITPIDMFPHTNHLEVVGLIKRNVKKQ